MMMCTPLTYTTVDIKWPGLFCFALRKGKLPFSRCRFICHALICFRNLRFGCGLWLLLERHSSEVSRFARVQNFWNTNSSHTLVGGFQERPTCASRLIRNSNTEYFSFKSMIYIRTHFQEYPALLTTMMLVVCLRQGSRSLLPFESQLHISLSGWYQRRKILFLPLKATRTSSRPWLDLQTWSKWCISASWTPASSPVVIHMEWFQSQEIPFLAWAFQCFGVKGTCGKCIFRGTRWVDIKRCGKLSIICGKLRDDLCNSA